VPTGHRLLARHLRPQFLEPVLDNMEAPWRALFIADLYDEQALAIVRDVVRLSNSKDARISVGSREQRPARCDGRQSH